MSKNNKVTLMWVREHTGIEGNEIVDRLARKRAQIPFLGPESFCGISSSVMLKKLKIEEESRRSKYWTELQGLKPVKILLGNYDQKRFKECISLSKNQLRVLIGS